MQSLCLGLQCWYHQSIQGRKRRIFPFPPAFFFFFKVDIVDLFLNALQLKQELMKFLFWRFYAFWGNQYLSGWDTCLGFWKSRLRSLLWIIQICSLQPLLLVLSKADALIPCLRLLVPQSCIVAALLLLSEHEFITDPYAQDGEACTMQRDVSLGSWGASPTSAVSES